MVQGDNVVIQPARPPQHGGAGVEGEIHREDIINEGVTFGGYGSAGPQGKGISQAAMAVARKEVRPSPNAGSRFGRCGHAHQACASPRGQGPPADMQGHRVPRVCHSARTLRERRSRGGAQSRPSLRRVLILSKAPAPEKGPAPAQFGRHGCAGQCAGMPQPEPASASPAPQSQARRRDCVPSCKETRQPPR